MRELLSRVLPRLWPKSVWGCVAVVMLALAGLIVAVPVLLFAMVVGSHIAGALWGAVNAFNSPRTAPLSSEMIGIYSLKPVSAEFPAKLASTRVNSSEVELKADGSAKLSSVYQYLEPFGKGDRVSLCQISGPGIWRLANNGNVEILIHLGPEALIRGGKRYSSQSWVSYEVLGRGRTHRLWSYLGDPDTDTGLEYAPWNQR